MKRMMWRRAAPVALMLAIVLAGTTWAEQDQTAPKVKRITPSQKVEEPASDDPTAPGPHHRYLEGLSGRWGARARLWISAEEDPVEFRGAAMSEMILGGRFLKTDYKGFFMGESVVGFGLDGYDNISGKHQGVWADSQGTAMFVFEGTWNDDGTVMTAHGEAVDSTSGEKRKVRTITTIKSYSMYTFESQMEGDDGEFVTQMQILFNRE